MIPLCVLPCALLELLASSPAAICNGYAVPTTTPKRSGTSGTAGNRLARDDKKAGAPAVAINYPENDLVKPPRRDTRALAQPKCSEERRPLRLAAQKSRPRAPLAPMHSMPAYFLGKWGVQTEEPASALH
jgi:hypothetical protein